MTRTIRKVPIRRQHRRPLTQRTRKAKYLELAELDDLGARLQSRVSTLWIPSAYGDLKVSSLTQYHPYRLWLQKRCTEFLKSRPGKLQFDTPDWYEWHQNYLRTKNNARSRSSRSTQRRRL
jgi:hypothetical protein